ncbi:MAG TPA: alpha/beta hydrolase [Anaerolineales bacterium]|nr:alpha/beta hydrolase [Anaerolineales bacterium]
MSHLIPGEYDVTLNGVRIHYAVRGEGPVMIAHSGGPGMDARGWDNFGGIDEFVTIVAIHPRGSGLSGPAAEDAYLLPDYAADVQALRLHLGVDKPIVMGWSHGGMVAMQFAFTYLDALSKLILFETSAYFGEFLGDIEGAVQEFKHEKWFKKSFAALKAEWDGDYKTDEDMSRLWAEEMRFYFKKFDERAEAYHERTKDLPLRIASLKTFNEREAPTLDLRPHLRKITMPTLVLVGRHDFITNVAMAEEIAKHIPNARLEIFEDSGHYAFVEEPEKFYRLVKEFVER